MKLKSAKSKGSRLENKVAGAYRHYGIDKDAKRMPLSGGFSHFPGDISKPNDYQFLDECKNSERVQLWEWWNQTSEQAGNRIPVLHISRNHSPILTVMRMEDYMQLRKTIKDLEQIVAGKNQ